MSAGRAIVVTSIGSNLEAVRDAALIVPVENAKALAGAIVRLAGDPGSAGRARTEGAREVWGAKTTRWIGRSRLIWRTYLDLLSKKRAGRRTLISSRCWLLTGYEATHRCAGRRDAAVRPGAAVCCSAG